MTKGTVVPKLGYYLPFAVFAGIGATLGSGLISTWGPYTSTGMWVGYQILYGIRGCGIQLVSFGDVFPSTFASKSANSGGATQAVIAIQNALPPKQSQIGVAFLVFCQNLSAAIFVVVGNTIFTQSLIKEVRKLVPSVSPVDVLRAGGSASAVRNLVPPGSLELAALLRAYSNAFDIVCYLMIALGSISVFAAFGMGWIDIRSKKPEPKTETTTEA
jgi:hypothetical protein